MSKRNLSLLALSALSLLLCAGIAYFFIFKTTNPNAPAHSETEVVRNIPFSEPWAAEKKDSTVENVNDFIFKIDEELADPNISDAERKRLLIYKAQAIAAPRTFTVQTDRIQESGTILKTLYESEALTESEVVTKNGTVPSYLSILIGSCYPTQMGSYLPDEYASVYKAFLDKGYSDKAAVILAYRDFATRALDTQFKNDKATVIQRAYIGALYLHSFGKTDNSFDQEVLRSVKEDVAQYNKTLEKKLFTGLVQGDVEPAQFYAYAYDIANSFGVTTVNPLVNAEIDSRYEKVYADINLVTDSVSRSIIAFTHTVFYMESLDRRYGAAIDVKKMDQLAEALMTYMSSSRDVKELTRGFLLEGQADLGSWMKARSDFYEVAKKYPKLKSYLEQTAGIKF